MTVVTLKGFAGTETVNVYPYAKAEVYVRTQRETPPGTPFLTAPAVAGVVSFDLPDNQEYLAYGLTSKVSKQIVNAVTAGGSVPWAPAV